ncbi:MAG TPA: S53 family peptidase [Gaiellaceae bacterium]|nr:S53 family peptidase [Gaiellaceae bacterium]
MPKILTVKKLYLSSLAAAALLALVVGSPTGAADPGFQVFRDHGHGAWFRRVCDLSFGPIAGCEAQVVSDAGGDPLAGSTPPSSALGPAQLRGAYGLTNAAPPGGATPTVAVVDAYDDPNAEADLGVFDGQWGLPPCTTQNGCFKKVNQSGGTSYPATNSGWALEISLDVQTVRAICPACHILLVEASTSSIANLGAAENEAVALGAVAISNSWGASESAFQTAWDSAYFNHPGVAITASTGDSGYGVSWPASSPSVTAVGGTTLTVDAAPGPTYTYGGETAWADGGSGCSSVETQPAWQAGLGSCGMRSVADVAADADPNTGAAVYDSVPYSGSSGWFQVGGTSLSSPIIASVYGLADNTSTIADGSTPYAYRGTAALHDVSSGSNGSCGSYLCNAGVGYDGPTGVGTPNGVTAFSPGGGSPPPPTTPDFSLGVSTQSGNIVAGTAGSASFTVTVNKIGGFSDQVTLSAPTLPSGVTASFSPNPAPSTSALTLTAGATAAAGTYPITINGDDGSLHHSVNATLTVTAPAPDFSISVSPGSQTLGPTGSVSYTVTITPLHGFSGTVSLSVSGLPNRVSATFSPSSVTAGSGWTATLRISSNRARPSSSTLAVRGRNGSLSHTATAGLTVT